MSEPGFNDCVSWGSFSGNSTLMANCRTTAGTPAPALSSGMALRRLIAPGCPTLLEASDDTNSATDFSLTTPNPRQNSVTPTDVPCPGTGGPTGYPPASAGSSPEEEVQEAQAPLGRGLQRKTCKKHK